MPILYEIIKVKLFTSGWLKMQREKMLQQKVSKTASLGVIMYSRDLRFDLKARK